MGNDIKLPTNLGFEFETEEETLNRLENGPPDSEIIVTSQYFKENQENDMTNILNNFKIRKKDTLTNSSTNFSQTVNNIIRRNKYIIENETDCITSKIDTRNQQRVKSKNVEPENKFIKYFEPFTHNLEKETCSDSNFGLNSKNNSCESECFSTDKHAIPKNDDPLLEILKENYEIDIQKIISDEPSVITEKESPCSQNSSQKVVLSQYFNEESSPNLSKSDNKINLWKLKSKIQHLTQKSSNPEKVDDRSSNPKICEDNSLNVESLEDESHKPVNLEVYSLNPENSDSLNPENIEDNYLNPKNIVNNFINAKNIKDNTFNHENMECNAFNSENIEDNFINTENVEDTILNPENMECNPLNSENIENNSLSPENMQDNSLNPVNMEDNTVNTENMEDNSLNSETMEDNSLISETMEDNSSNPENMEDNSSNTENMEDISLNPKNMEDNSLNHENMEDNPLNHENMEDNSLNHENMEDNSLNHENMEDNSLNHENMEDNPLNHENMEDNSLNHENMKDNSLNPETMEDNSSNPENMEDNCLVSESFEEVSTNIKNNEDNYINTENLEKNNYLNPNILQNNFINSEIYSDTKNTCEILEEQTSDPDNMRNKLLIENEMKKKKNSSQEVLSQEHLCTDSDSEKIVCSQYFLQSDNESSNKIDSSDCSSKKIINLSKLKLIPIQDKSTNPSTMNKEKTLLKNIDPQKSKSKKQKRGNKETMSSTSEKTSDEDFIFTKEFLPEKLHKFKMITKKRKRVRLQKSDSPKIPPGGLKPLWTPPKSPHGLIEEDYVSNPWGLLVATIFLNKTSGKQAKPFIDDFLLNYPTPESVVCKKPEDFEVYFEELGLKKRSEQIWRMSKDFLEKNWTHARELHGIGKYGDDAFRLFCIGDLKIEPSDRYLKIYHRWVTHKDKWKK